MPDFELKGLTAAALASQKCDALVLLVTEQDAASLSSVDSPMGRALAQALEHKDLSTKAGSILAMYSVPGLSARRLLLCGAADGGPRAVRQAVLAAFAALKGAPVKDVSLYAGQLAAASLEQAVLAAGEASYHYALTRSKPEASAPVGAPQSLQRVRVLVPSAPALKAAFDRACGLASGVALAREWGNRPGNHATPSQLAQAAKALVKDKTLSCDVLGPKEVRKLGMGAFEAVAQGSAEPLRFIVLKYQGAAKTEAPVVLVGKGITFDTGGISIKPAAEMDEMKFDMCGAASVLGTFRALADIKPAINVVGLIPSCENMPDGRAIKPGDVVTSMSGQTIEILNTDAEGRLILCDALTYAKRFEPRAVIDIATLTGACVVALGGVRSGLFASSDALAHALQAAGDAALDPCWRLPLDDEYAEGLKTHFADVANVAGRAGGAVTAAKFLQRFVTGMDWAHLDIAGSAWKSGGAKGATGRPVGLLVHYLLTLAAQGPVASTVRRTPAKRSPKPASA